MRTKDILIELIQLVHEYDERIGESDELTMAGFLGFATGKTDTAVLKVRNDSGDQAPWLVEMGEETDTVIARLVTVMNRYAKSYIKRALHGSPIQTGEEFSFMLYLMTFESLTKTELINKNILEKTSGMEVIKRLLKLEYIQEFDDSHDKRSKRIALTREGRNELLKVLPVMRQVSSLVTGNLNDQERSVLAHLLKKLDHYHHDVFVNDKLSDFEDLTKKYLITR